MSSLESMSARPFCRLPKRQRIISNDASVQQRLIAPAGAAASAAAMSDTFANLRHDQISNDDDQHDQDKDEEREREIDHHRKTPIGSNDSPAEARERDTQGLLSSLSNQRIRPPILNDLDDDDDAAAAYKTDAELEREYPLFGRAGHDCVRGAAAYQSGGLFKGISWATDSTIATASGEHSTECEGDDLDDEGYVHPRGRSYSSGDCVQSNVEGHTAGAASLFEDLDDGFGSGNLKKRKTPGMTHAGHGSLVSEDRFYQEEEQTALPPSLPSILVIKATASDLPKTAKAALAKLRPIQRQCFDRGTIYARRSRHKHFRSFLARHAPLVLPACPVYSVPRSVWNGPLPLPPGSGLKGSKAVKAAMKAEKEREKQKVRMKAALGDIVLPATWWDEPLRVISSPAAATASTTLTTNRSHSRRTGARVESGLLTPPHSSSSDEAESPPRRSSDLSNWLSTCPSIPPQLESFSFHMRASPVIWTRWLALLNRLQQMLITKEKELRKQKEAIEEKLEKAREAVKVAQEEKDAMQKTRADRSSRTSAPQNRSAPSSAATTKTTSTKSSTLTLPRSNPPSQSSRPRTSSSSTLPPLATTTSPVHSPLISHPASSPVATAGASSSSSSLPLPPPARKPPLKGRRKRAAHANSLNVHHRDNYVPSRAAVAPVHAMSHSLNGTESNPQLLSWPASEGAIAAAAARKGSKYGKAFFGDSDEWVCAWCDYDILYGDSSKAIRKRKKLLNVRKRASDRAASSVSGGGAVISAAVESTPTTPTTIATASAA